MIEDREIWACALETIRQHGVDAAIHAAMRADELLQAGEYEGAAVWRRIVRRINELDAPARSPTH